MLIFLFIVSIVDCATNIKCTKNYHTNTYKYCINNDIPLESLFIRKTYLNGEDPCYPLDDYTYRRILEQNNISQPHGFIVSHIIDTENSVDGYLYILGNLILSNSSWIKNMDSFCWDNVKEEKEIVFKDIFDEAYKNVLECKERGTNSELPVHYYALFFILFFYFYILTCGCFLQQITLEKHTSELNKKEVNI